ncbi:hypothetical protein KSP39_PZI001158 [Platanthera zijinensis]|uniref:Uncharacterized protein n=1 Tax=Platanthera zijinensis TaxID=2320716 RepID=A0AAP0GG00_9ASPA
MAATGNIDMGNYLTHSPALVLRRASRFLLRRDFFLDSAQRIAIPPPILDKEAMEEVKTGRDIPDIKPGCIV